METRKRSRPEDERERAATRSPPAPEHPLLELQRGAGNRAVSALLARDAKPKEEEKPKDPAAAGTHATLPDIGVIPLESVQFGSRRGPGNARREKGEKDTSGEIVLTSRVGAHSQALMKASIDGQPMTVEIVIAGGGGSVKLVLKGALIASYSAGAGGHEAVESWTLDFASMEQSGQEDAKE